MADMQAFQVRGMTCEHCVRAVSAELEQIDGVTDVVVDLKPGADALVTVTSARPLPPEAAREAISRAGYEVAQ